MKYALVTGGCGFVGQQFCSRLIKENYSILCVDKNISESSLHPKDWPSHLSCREAMKNKTFEYLQMDIRDFFTLKHYSNRKFDLIIHLAAIVGGRLTIENNPLSVAEDLAIDAEFFKYLVSAPNKPGKVVYFSSSAAYPIEFQNKDEHKKILKEDMIDFTKGFGIPDYTYGMAKLIGEYLAKIAHEKNGINIVCYRPFSGYGETQNEAYPFIGILKRVIAKENPIEIWSNTTRDFVHIEDVVECVLQTMEKINDGSAINIGSGYGIEFKDLVKIMCSMTGHKAKVKILQDKPQGVFYRVADPTFVNSLGWKPSISLEEGITRAVEFLIDQDLKF